MSELNALLNLTPPVPRTGAGRVHYLDDSKRRIQEAEPGASESGPEVVHRRKKFVVGMERLIVLIRDGNVDLNSLAAIMNVSRTTISNYARALQEDGRLFVEATPGGRTLFQLPPAKKAKP